MTEKEIKFDNFRTEKIEDGKFIIDHVEREIHIPTKLSGNAIVTHFGGNGRFRFILDGKSYNTVHQHGKIAKLTGETAVEYFDYNNVQMDIADDQMLNMFNKHYVLNKIQAYWKEIHR